MYDIGSIILVENHIFKNTKGVRKYEIDHCRKRPAIVIAEDSENFYYLTLTSTKGKDFRQFKFHNKNKESYITLENIYEKKIYGAIERERLSDKQLLELLQKFYNYHVNKQDPMFKKIEKLVLAKIKELVLNNQQIHKK